MSLDNFKHNLTVLSKDEEKDVRNKYLELFVDTHKEYYKRYIDTLKKYSDGLCYTGYLWDCIRDAKVIDLKYVEAVSCN